MSPHLKTRLIDAYRIATWPVRRYRLQHMKQQGQVPIAILFYHRVDNEHPNPWTISEKDFQKQINWFQRNFDLVSLEECQKRIASGFNERPTLSITFDDGYADNCTYALPMLIERGIPVTYFVTTYHTTLGQPFPHDIKNGRPLAPNSIESLIAMSNAGVEIGAHTRSHPDLGKISNHDQLLDEVIWATHQMEKLIDKKIRYFAFPFGQVDNLNPSVFQLLKEYGFEGVCSAYGGFNHVGDDTFHLQRMHGDPNFSRMRNWLSFDPRLERVKRYDYQAELSLLETTFEKPVLPQEDQRGRKPPRKVYQDTKPA